MINLISGCGKIRLLISDSLFLGDYKENLVQNQKNWERNKKCKIIINLKDLLNFSKFLKITQKPRKVWKIFSEKILQFTKKK